jgi:hypothetical protein
MEYQKILVGDTPYEFPVDMSDDEITQLLRKETQATEVATPTPEKPALSPLKPLRPLKGSVSPVETPQEQPKQAYRPFSQVRADVTVESLKEDKDWLDASSMMYQMWERKPYEGSNEDLVEWSRGFMADFNYNLIQTGRSALRLEDQDQTTKEAFLFMMDTFDNTEMSWGGAWNTTKAIATDPTTWVGISTVIGAGARPIVAGAAKETLRQMLKSAIGRTGAVAGLEGGIILHADDRIRQGIETSAGRQEEFDAVRSAKATALGVAGGAVLGTVADLGITALKGLKKAPTPEVPTIRPDLLPTRFGDEFEDVIPPDVTPTPTVDAPIIETREVKGFSVASIRTGVKTVPTTRAELDTFAADLARQLKEVGAETSDDAIGALRKADMTPEEWLVFGRSVQMASEEKKKELAELLGAARTVDPEGEVALQRQIGELEVEVTALDSAESAMASLAGAQLQARKFGLPELRNLTPATLMESEGLTREAAEVRYQELVLGAYQSQEAKKITRAFDAKVDKALADGDMREALRLVTERNREVNHLVGIGQNEAGFWAKATEFSISNVFSATTLAINLVPSGVKTLVVPGMKALLTNPLQKAVRAEMAASYSAMRSSTGGAWRAAKASWRYEQALLTRDADRFLESGLAIKGVKGGVIRFFPRALNATDEFLSQLNYNAFVAGKAASEAAYAGAEKGLIGRELDAFIKEASKSAVENAYKQDSAEALISPIVKKGVNLKLKGEELNRYIETEAMKDPSAIRAGSDQEALDLVRDMLYKREFTGKGMISGGAKAYEDYVNKYPVIKVAMGQLFFRTPIRVFEEGLRFTPGIQFLMPNYLSDLRGLNGLNKQVRARGEALMGLTMTSAIMTMYAEGRLTGDGAYSDWRQQRLRQDSQLPDPYTIKLEDGSTWNYRFFDPVATPIKIIVNTLERMDQLAIREAQGEFINQAEWKQATALMTVATGAITSAVRDANLFAGINGTIEALEAAGNPEDKAGAFVKYFGEKLHLMAPNTLHKIAKSNDPTMSDPATFYQMLQTRLLTSVGGRDTVLTSKSYDHMGRVRTMTDIGTLHNIFSTATVEERSKGRSPQELFVDQELDRLQKETGLVIRVPINHSYTGTLDLRTVSTEAGDRTLFDRWNQIYAERLPVDALYAILASPLPDGTFKHKGARVATVSSLISQVRDMAFKEMMSEESAVIDRMINGKLKSATSKAGLWDSDRKTPTPKFETPWSQ